MWLDSTPKPCQIPYCRDSQVETSRFTDEEQLITKAVDILIKELGPVEAIRFLALPKQKRVEAVKRHRQWQIQLRPDKFFDRVFGARSRGAAKK